jgi:hypothetical protein
MIHKITRALLALCLLLFLAGVASFHLGSGTWSWVELPEAWIWYWGRQREHLLPLCLALGATIGLGSALAVVTARARDRFRRALAQGQLKRRRAVDLDDDALVKRARRELNGALRDPHARPERLVDALLGTIVDSGAHALKLAPAGAGVAITLIREGRPLPATSMERPQYERVVALLRLMSGIEGDGEGKMDLRSSRRADRLRITFSGDARDTATTLRVIGRDDPTDPAAVTRATGRAATDGPLSVAEAQASPLRRVPSTVARLEEPIQPANVTGELPVLFSGDEDTTDSHLSTVLGLDPSSEGEIAPVIAAEGQRPIGPPERWLRLALGLSLGLSLLIYFWEAFGWGQRWLTTAAQTAPWRDVVINLSSRPRAGTVSIQGHPIGRTPMQLKLPCRGRKIEVVIQARGFRSWQWGGICPDSRRLDLEAWLQPL